MDNYFTQMEKQKLLITVVIGTGLYLLSTGLSYAAFSLTSNKESYTLKSPLIESTNSNKGGLKRTVSNLPKTEVCPINGAMYTKDDKTFWETHRPLGVMIENTKVARPQSGLSFADVVYEAVAEGGITRFLAVFYCQDPEIVGPIRSARTYYLDWISEYADYPLYLHIGGANTPGPADALGQIRRYGWEIYNDIEGLGSYDFPPLLIFSDSERIPGTTATEHIKYAYSKKVWEDLALKKRGLGASSTDDATGKEVPWNANFVSWKFKDDTDLADRPQTLEVTFGLSNIQASYADDYTINWKYDQSSNAFLRTNGGVPHLDMNTNQQITAKNIILQYETMSIADDGYEEEGHGQHTLYQTKGMGKAKFLIDGKVIDGTWSKKTRTDRTKYLDNSGSEIKFNRGAIWIEILPIGQQVTVQ